MLRNKHGNAQHSDPKVLGLPQNVGHGAGRAGSGGTREGSGLTSSGPQLLNGRVRWSVG